MKYICFIAFARIRRNLRQYIAVALQIALGTGILYSALAMQSVAERQYSEMKNTMESSVISLTGHTESGEPSITSEDYFNLLDNIPSKEISTSYESWYYIYAITDEGEKQIPVFVVSDNYFEDLMGMQTPNTNKAYIGKNIAAFLRIHNFAITNNASEPDKENLLLGMSVDEFETLKNNIFAQTAKNAEQSAILALSGHQSGLLFDDSIIFPISMQTTTDELNGTLYFTIDVNSPDATELHVKKVMDFLTERHPGASYMYRNPYRQFENTYQNKEDTATLLTVVALVLFGIMSFGFIGLLLLVINKRRISLSVCRMCGASIQRLSGELFVEVALVVFLGATVGLVVAFAAMPMQSSYLFVAQNSPVAVLQCLLGLLAVCLIVCGAGIMKIARVSPITALKSQ